MTRPLIVLSVTVVVWLTPGLAVERASAGEPLDWRALDALLKFEINEQFHRCDGGMVSTIGISVEGETHEETCRWTATAENPSADTKVTQSAGPAATFRDSWYDPTEAVRFAMQTPPEVELSMSITFVVDTTIPAIPSNMRGRPDPGRKTATVQTEVGSDVRVPLVGRRSRRFYVSGGAGHFPGNCGGISITVELDGPTEAVKEAEDRLRPELEKLKDQTVKCLDERMEQRLQLSTLLMDSAARTLDARRGEDNSYGDEADAAVFLNCAESIEPDSSAIVNDQRELSLTCQNGSLRAEVDTDKLASLRILWKDGRELSLERMDVSYFVVFTRWSATSNGVPLSGSFMMLPTQNWFSPDRQAQHAAILLTVDARRDESEKAQAYLIATPLDVGLQLTHLLRSASAEWRF